MTNSLANLHLSRLRNRLQAVFRHRKLKEELYGCADGEFHRIMKDIGLSAHDLRHSWATRASRAKTVDQGVPGGIVVPSGIDEHRAAIGGDQVDERVTERIVERPPHGVGGDARQRCRRLTDLQGEDAVSRRFELGRRPAHRHGVERGHGSGSERGIDHRSIVPAGVPGASRTRWSGGARTHRDRVGSQDFLTLQSPDTRRGNR